MQAVLCGNPLAASQAVAEAALSTAGGRGQASPNTISQGELRCVYITALVVLIALVGGNFGAAWYAAFHEDRGAKVLVFANGFTLLGGWICVLTLCSIWTGFGIGHALLFVTFGLHDSGLCDGKIHSCYGLPASVWGHDQAAVWAKYFVHCLLT